MYLILDKLYSLIIALCGKTEILKPENIVEVVRRCSIAGSNDGQLNMTLMG